MRWLGALPRSDVARSGADVSKRAEGRPLRVLLVEDNAKFAGLLEKLLTENGYAVDVVPTVERAAAALGAAHYVLVLLDLSLPDGDGREILRRLRRGAKGTMVLVTTARGAVVDRVETLDAGADDYLVKPFSPEELLARVRALLRRPTQIVPNILSAGNLALDTASLTLTVEGRPVELPRREMSVLAELLMHRGRVLRREQLEEAVYPFDTEVTPNAIEAAISRLRRRLEAAGAQVSVTAMRGIGYVLAERPQC
jgi:DNA-binding response OmpR family regulator